MEYFPLPWLSARLGQPVLAAVEPFAGAAGETPPLPAEALILETRWPSSRFMTRIPGEVPGGLCYARLGAARKQHTRIAWEEWVDLFLSEVIARPHFTIADIQRLGPDRDLLATALLRYWHWIGDEQWEAFRRDTGLTDLILRFPELPSPSMQDALWFMSKTYKRLPSEFLDLPFPLFVFNYRVTLGAMRKRPESAGSQEFLEAVGVED